MDHPDLTPAELRVFRALGQVMWVPLIAARLGCSEWTVRSHIANLKSKFGASTLTELTVIASQHRDCC